jgi:cystathionine beta-lyase/cystathionine gamma-synthase
MAEREMDNFSGMLTFQVADGPALADCMWSALDVFDYAVSRATAFSGYRSGWKTRRTSSRIWTGCSAR